MSISRRLFGNHMTEENKTKPFHTNATREERQDWFARTRPWHRVPSDVINAILDGITDKTLLEVFVLTSMKNGLVERYEALAGDGRAGSSDLIRAQVSQILCLLGNRAMVSFTEALTAKQFDEASKAYVLIHDFFEPAIALAKNQVVAYAQLSAAYGMMGKRAECHEYARRGLEELAETQSLIRGSSVFRPEHFDQIERQLRAYLAS